MMQFCVVSKYSVSWSITVDFNAIQPNQVKEAQLLQFTEYLLSVYRILTVSAKKNNMTRG